MGESNHFDAIVIGSGMGGLTAASAMAQVGGKRVLVLERHYVIGGFTHTFRRPGKFEWDVGVHYVGRMGPKHNERAAFDFVTQGRVGWNRMPEPFDKIHFPDFSFTQFTGEARLLGDLTRKFPHEKRALKRYFKDLKKAERWGVLRFIAGTTPLMVRLLLTALTAAGTKRALATTKSQIDKRIADPKLKALLAAPWIAYGLPPSKSAFAVHAAVARHYFQGGYYPEGGAGEIARQIVPIIERRGGAVLKNHEVTRILIEGGKAVGVEVRTRVRGTELVRKYFAPKVISDVGAYKTYADLLPEEIGGKYAKRLKPLLAKASAVSLYLGLNDSPETLGIKGENHWLYEGYDHEIHHGGSALVAGRPTNGHFSFPSLKTSRPAAHTAEIFALTDYDAFVKWADKPWKKRGKSYERLKEKITDGFIDLIERRHPGFSKLIVYKELSTPLTIEHFTGHARGTIYGLPPSPEKFRTLPISAMTPVKNLYLTGADVLCVGIVPATLTGLAAAGAALGSTGFLRVMTRVVLRRLGFGGMQAAGKTAPPLEGVLQEEVRKTAPIAN